MGKLIVAKGLKKVPKVQKIAQSGHTGAGGNFFYPVFFLLQCSQSKVSSRHFVRIITTCCISLLKWLAMSNELLQSWFKVIFGLVKFLDTFNYVLAKFQIIIWSHCLFWKRFREDEQQPQQRRDKIKFSCKLLLFNSFKEKAENNFDSPHHRDI